MVKTSSYDTFLHGQTYHIKWEEPYAGIIQIIFHVLQLLLIWFAQQNLCYISESMLKNLKKNQIKDHTLPKFSYDYHPPRCIHY